MNPVRRWVTANAGMLVAALAGGAWFLSCASPVANPLSVDALLVDDWSTHLLGWLFFRHESFHLPVGRVDGLLYPMGTTIGYTDSIPWPAFFLRPVSWALPTDFQYLGPFMLGGFVFNGACGAWLVRAVSPRQVDQALGGTLFALLPALLLRLGHPSLCAQGLLLVPLGMCLRAATEPKQARRMGLWALGLCVLTAGFHPYLAVMMASLASAVPLKLRFVDHTLGTWWVLGLLVAMPVSMGLVFAFFGYFLGGVERGGAGFGAFSADLGTFFNPLTYSRFLQPRPQGPMQYEGFAYLGLGVMAVIGCAALLLVGRIRQAFALPWRRLAFLAPGVLLTAFFAFATPWTLHGQMVTEFTRLYAAIPASLVGPFRSSGRFIWPLMYALVTFGVVGVVRLARPWPVVAPALLALCVSLQLADVTRAPVAARFKPGSVARFEHPAWQQLDGRYQHLALVPAEIWSVCQGPAGYRQPLVVALSYHAYRHGLTFNSGYVARSSVEQPRVCAQEEAKVLRGELDPHTVYVVWPDQAQGLREQGASCGSLDGLLVCVRPGAADGFARALEGGAPR